MSTLKPLDTPEKVARFVAFMGYPRDQIVRAIARDFPQADAEAVADEAVAHEAAQQSRRP